MLVEARVDTLEKQLRKANDSARRNFKDIEGSAQNARRRIEADTKTLAERANANLSKIGVGVKPITVGVTLGGLSAAALAREATRYADAWTSAGNKLAAAGVVPTDMPTRMREIYQIAQDSRSALAPTADLYAKLLRAAGPLGKTQLEVAQATQIVNKAFAAGGASAAEQASGILQLSQALGSGTLQGDELRSLLENAPLLAKAIADGFGVTVGELKKLGAEGTLESGKVFDAILKGGQDIERQFAATTPTVEAAMTRVQNAITKYVGEADGSLGATARLKAGLNALANDFNKVADVALKAAGVLAAAFLGRSVAGMVAGLGTAAGAVMNLVAALRSLGTAGALAGAFGGLGAAAGPIGAVLGIAAATALYFGTKADEAAEAAQRAADGIKALGISANSTTDDLKKVADQLARLSGAEIRVKIAETSALITARANGLRDTDLSAEDKVGRGKVINPARADFDRLTATFLDGRRTLGSYIAELDGLAARFPKLAAVFAEAQQKAQEYEAALKARAAQDAALGKQADTDGRTLGVASPDYETVARDAANQAALAGERNTAQAAQFIAEQKAEAAKNLTERKIDEQTNKLVKAFEAAGGKITDAIRESFRAEAARGVDVGEAAKGVFDMIAKFESFREKAYWDVNHWRAGYGSDTTTRADGSVEKVTQSTVVSVADAVRDLNRRIAEFQNGARNKVGAETFDALSAEQKAALTSIAYNYGQLPARIVRALVGGTTADVAKAIRGLGNDNGGVNRDRRDREAAVYEGGITPAQRDSDRTREASQREADRQAESVKRVIDALQLEGDQLGKTADEQELLNALSRAGVDANSAEGQSIRQKVADLQRLRAAQAQADRGTEAARQARETIRDMGASATTSILQDLRAGASAAEAFGNALGRVGDQLIEMAVKQLFQNAFAAPAGGGGGLGFFGFLGTLFGFSEGGWTGPGSKYQPAGIVHADEFVFSKEATKRIGVDNLEAMHRAGKGYASGGRVGSPSFVPAAVRRPEGVGGNGAQAITINAPVTVNATGGTPEQNDDLAKRISKEFEGTVKGMVAQELRTQMRPGNMMNRGR